MRAGADWAALAAQVRADWGIVLERESLEAVGGGCINETWRVGTSGGIGLLKLNRPERADMFEAEAEGLEALAAAGAVRVPAPLASGRTRECAYLLLEWIELGRPDRGSERVLGEQLASLHRSRAERYGWHRDNTIGLTPQPNGWMDDWVAFLGERRIGFQLGLAARHGHARELAGPGERLLASLHRLFDGYRPVASLLHGDLWGGNWRADALGAPVIFDPAVYYGDRESDLAMTELFGGFGPDFYAAYDAAWPRDDGYRVRRDLYQLYHVLNHLNLFGGSYLAQARALLQRLLHAADA